MPSPVLNNNVQAWTAGATYLNTYLSNQGSQNTVDFQNASNTQLFVGDVVALGSSTSGSFVVDPTALSCSPAASAANINVVGVVGGEVWNPGSPTVTPAQVGGGLIPPQSSSWVYSSGTWTSGTATLTDANGSTINIGKAVYGIGWPTTPGLQSIVTAFSAGAYTVTIAPNVTEGSATAYFLGPAEGATGPAFPGIPGYGGAVGTPNATNYVPGSMVPVVTRGWAYINIGGNTVAAGASLAMSGTTRVAAAVTTSGAYVASSPGTFIGVALEAQSAGLGSPDGSASKIIRAWIQKY